ncbi:hypothetical protein RAB80_013447 [Fusarium oxysporum f. sp. vasinfectum]|nr:hypothetical protein RAB80_013447 [Fusarium oxysporum f. sp. vasinfectum]
MPSDLSAYLASKYLVADPKPAKKRKRKRGADANNGLLITDDDDSGWGNTNTQQDDEGIDAPVTVSGRSAEFRKTRKSNWKSVGGDATSKDDSAAAAAADAILASAAAEQNAARDEDEDMPIIEDDESAVKMSDGTHAGLQSAATVSAQLKRRQKEEREEFERHRKSAKEEETVYRDATGRRIDISMKRAEARRSAAEAEEKERLAKKLSRVTYSLRRLLMSFARTADDEEMNQELKEQERWNDPMMQFMAEKKQTDTGQSKKAKRKPVYAGAAPPNRYGIKPGYRWDGVDRGNGFEAERFKALNRRERNKGLEYSWQMDE